MTGAITVVECGACWDRGNAEIPPGGATRNFDSGDHVIWREAVRAARTTHVGSCRRLTSGSRYMLLDRCDMIGAIRARLPPRKSLSAMQPLSAIWASDRRGGGDAHTRPQPRSCSRLQ